jgi:hypothetical protein
MVSKHILLDRNNLWKATAATLSSAMPERGMLINQMPCQLLVDLLLRLPRNTRTPAVLLNTKSLLQNVMFAYNHDHHQLICNCWIFVSSFDRTWMQQQAVLSSGFGFDG